MAEDRDRCLQAGCNDYTTKPIDKAKLIGKCAHWIERMREAQPSTPHLESTHS